MEGFRFGPTLTDRVIDVVKRVGDMPYKYGNASIPVRFEEDDGEPRLRLKLGTVSATWAKGGTATVREIKEWDDGEPVYHDPDRTFEAFNWCQTVNVISGVPRRVACAFVGGTWMLTEVDRGVRFATFTGAWPKGTSKNVTLSYIATGGAITANAPSEVASVTNYVCDISNDCGTRNCYIAEIDGGWHLLSAELV